MATLEISVPADFDVERLDAQPNEIKLAPVFYGKGKESAPCALFQVRDAEGKVAGRYMLIVDGRRLTLRLDDRSKPAMALVERRLLEEKLRVRSDETITQTEKVAGDSKPTEG